jgi:hypothetical protein
MSRPTARWGAGGLARFSRARIPDPAVVPMCELIAERHADWDEERHDFSLPGQKFSASEHIATQRVWH